MIGTHRNETKSGAGSAAGKEGETMDKKFEYILAAADCGSISRAAELLYVTQPSLSRFIAKTEEELGLKLFRRAADGIRLTPAGEVYVRYAREMKQLQGRMDRELSLLRQEENQNEIVICMTLNTSSMSTWQITEKFNKRYPECRLNFINTLAKNLQNQLDEQRCSLAIGPDAVDHSRYKLRLLNTNYLLLAVPRIYDVETLSEEREGLPFRWIDLNRCPPMDFLLQEPSCNVRREIDKLLQELKKPLCSRMEFTNSILVIQAAERQMGCCFISESFLPYITDPGKMRYYCVGQEYNQTSSYAIFDRSRKLSRKEEYCVSLIKQTLREQTEKNRREILGDLHK